MEVVNPINAVLDPRERYTLKSIYDFLRASSRPVPTGKPQVVGHKVDIPLLCKLVVEAGGKDNVSTKKLGFSFLLFSPL